MLLSGKDPDELREEARVAGPILLRLNAHFLPRDGDRIAQVQRNRPMTTPDHIAAHGHSSRHRAGVLASELCGCFHCKETFPPSEIERWLNEGDGTALCPRCGIDSVIGSASGFPVNAELLERMHGHWFG